MNGVLVTIYRADGFGDSTAGGVTSPERARGKTFVVFDRELASGNWKLDECRDRPDFVCLRLVRRNIAGSVYIHAEPICWRDGYPVEPVRSPMAGGNFIFTGDSRFCRVCEHPVSVHDRFEVEA